MKRVVYRGHNLAIEKESFKVRGKPVEITREIRPDVIMVVPLLSNGKLLLERQYRHALKKYSYEFPAGHVESRETPVKAAIRELEEETGYTPLEIKLVAHAYQNPGYGSQIAYFYLAKRLRKGHRRPDRTERIAVVEASPERINKMILNKTVMDVKTILAFLYCIQNRLIQL